VLESHAFDGESIEFRRLVGLAAVACERFVAQVIGHDEDNVRLTRRDGIRKKDRKQHRDEVEFKTHESIPVSSRPTIK
jgi:hypothetical protein